MPSLQLYHGAGRCPPALVLPPTAVRDGAPQAGRVNLVKALATAREVAGAMEYLHSQNVLHGDLNGNNILLAGAHVGPGAGARGLGVWTGHAAARVPVSLLQISSLHG